MSVFELKKHNLGVHEGRKRLGEKYVMKEKKDTNYSCKNQTNQPIY